MATSLKPTKKNPTATSKFGGFTEDERAAMKEHAKELKAAAGKAEAERDVLAKIAEMTDADRVIAERVHEVIKASAPDLTPRLWYGMPAYANQDGKLLCFFQPSTKFRARYATLGFNDVANLDDGTIWPTGFALTALTPDTEAKISDLVRRAAS